MKDSHNKANSDKESRKRINKQKLITELQKIKQF